jgi:capsular polysaccharide biosynthesis protein
MTELESGFRVADATALLRRRRLIFVIAAVAGIVLGAFAYSTSPPNYSATARVQLGTSGASETPAQAEARRQTQKDLMKSDAVGDLARKQLDLDITNRALFAGLTVKSREGSDVIGLTYEAGSPKVAQERVNAIARAYLDNRRAQLAESSSSRTEVLAKQLTEAERERDEANDAFEASEPGSIERVEADSARTKALRDIADLNEQITATATVSDDEVGSIVGEAPLPKSVISKLALAKGAGVFGVCMLAGLGAALFVDRRDSLGGGRRRVQQLAPSASIRLLPSANGGRVSSVEADAAVDRLAVDLAASGGSGKAASVLLVGTRRDLPIALAEELASSYSFAGVPALFVVAGNVSGDLPQTHVVTSFADLVAGPTITGPASLPEVAGQESTSAAPTVTWLRPRGSAESSGLLRRAIVDSLVKRAGSEGFDVVLFIAATPTLNAAGAALGQWVSQTAVIVEDDESAAVEATVDALRQAGVDITEVVWT